MPSDADFYIRWDVRGPHRVEYTEDGLLIVRTLEVYNIPISPGESDPSVLLKCLSQPLFPKWGWAYPDPSYSNGVVRGIFGKSIDRITNAGTFDFHYLAPFDNFAETGVIKYTLEDLTLSRQVTTYTAATQDISLDLIYGRGATGVQNFPLIAGDSYKVAGVPKFDGYRMLRATGRATKAQWDAVKGAVREAAFRIHSDDWGDYERGRWLFMGPQTRTTDKGQTYSIQLDFIEERFGHFPIIAYFNEFGEHPGDSSTEADVRAAGPPTEGNIITYNGITMASIYLETTFSDLFSFTPDAET
jgi:hypothetical protein